MSQPCGSHSKGELHKEKSPGSSVPCPVSEQLQFAVRIIRLTGVKNRDERLTAVSYKTR